MATPQPAAAGTLEEAHAQVERLTREIEALKLVAKQSGPVAASNPPQTSEPAAAVPTPEPQAASEPGSGLAREQRIDPWSVSSAVDAQGKALAFDYPAISQKWNTQLIDAALLERFERVTGKKPHRLMRRGLFFSHRDFDKILDTYERGDPFFIYTGRGPSSGSMHIGHTIPFEFTKFLSDTFDVPLVIMLTEDEKFLFSDKITTVEEAEHYANENAKDIIAMGFDPKRTFIFSDFRYMGSHFYRNSIEFSRLITQNLVRGAFGFNESTNIGRIMFPAVQCATAFATTFPHIWGDSPLAPRNPQTAKIPCLIPCAIDQDPYFRLLRDNQHRMKNPSPKAALIHSQFLTALQGAGGKMSASDPLSAIFTSDTAKDIKNKINKHAFSGGRASVEEHRRLGGDPSIDVPFQYLTYFLESDAELARIEASYRAGELLTGEIKKLCIDLLQAHIADFQALRAQVTDETVDMFMEPRKLEFSGNPNPDLEKRAAAHRAAEMAAGKADKKGKGDKSGKVDKAGKPERADGTDGAAKAKSTQRPGMPGRSTTYGIAGLKSYGKMVEEMLYPDGDSAVGSERE